MAVERLRASQRWLWALLVASILVGWQRIALLEARADGYEAAQRNLDGLRLEFNALRARLSALNERTPREQPPAPR